MSGLTVTATINMRNGISSFGLSSSSTDEPTTWLTSDDNGTVSGTSYNLSYTASSAGTYYLWAKDTNGNIIVSGDSVVLSSGLQFAGINQLGGWDNQCPSAFSINGSSVTINSSDLTIPASSGDTISGGLNGTVVCYIYLCTTSTCSQDSYQYVINGSSVTIDSSVKYYYLFETCFTKETYVWIYDEKKKKKKKIKVINLKKGMMLVHVNTKTVKISYDKVSDIEVHTAKEVYAIHVGGEVIRCSGGHTFYISENTVLMAKELQAGMKLLASAGKSYLIDKIEKETYPEGIELYTIITEKKNNYLVTSLKILSYVMVGYTLTVASLDIGYSRPGQTAPTDPTPGY